MSSNDALKTTMTWIIYFEWLIECANAYSARAQKEKTGGKMPHYWKLDVIVVSAARLNESAFGGHEVVTESVDFCVYASGWPCSGYTSARKFPHR